jgi:hypothetical protein
MLCKKNISTYVMAKDRNSLLPLIILFLLIWWISQQNTQNNKSQKNIQYNKKHKKTGEIE